ncbi:MAG: DUF47 family protein [Candidatus Methanomethylicaceae archaeon]|nr:DUF47 family protein [Candidatus Verstraetearchaeota archaeon]
MWRKIASFPLKGIEEGLKAHSQLVMDTIRLLSDLIEGCDCQNWNRVKSTADRIAFMEREADDVKRGVEIKLYSGILFVGLKEDFLRLVEAMDQIADRAKEASRALASREPSKEEMEEIRDCNEKVKEMVYGTIEIVNVLIRALEMINKNKNEALSLAHEVEKYEERLDDIKLEALKMLTTREKKTSPLTYLQIRDFIFLLDMIADAAESASDIITAMVVKSGA